MLTQDQLQRYEQDGFLVVKQLLTLSECQKLKTTVDRLIDDWEPEQDYSWMFPHGQTKERSMDQELIDSGDTISFFIENDAVDPQTVQSHRDSTYILSEPFKAVGIWIALEDATIENGCLWFIPGSNSTTTKRRCIRNPNEQEFNDGKVLIFQGEEEYDDSAFIPVEVKAGDAILIDGQVVHKSEQNKSPQTRQICAFHIFETHNSTYSKENWLQTATSFPLLYDD
ncbi:unnamed protein product [Rotaria sp. Silwood2]|nr:unnamed protein product [Rotaria sp. Silwood2]CAF3201969.1 unnamed protein product [Rotaria sp. Silwood2]CAF3385967.1 unnamed protein product [Rotaria sp. Silwood2]CAF4561507.1 unnamed protein product [Rotaria sp. Silwood2]CAF4572844.1 unnamed protein product [Rotaria sp. Silwood2]